MKRPYLSREFRLKWSSSKLKLVFYKPVRWRTSYLCHYEICVDNRVIRKTAAAGVDSVQALLLALGTALTDLEYGSERLRAKIPDAQLKILKID